MFLTPAGSEGSDGIEGTGIFPAALFIPLAVPPTALPRFVAIDPSGSALTFPRKVPSSALLPPPTTLPPTIPPPTTAIVVPTNPKSASFAASYPPYAPAILPTALPGAFNAAAPNAVAFVPITFSAVLVTAPPTDVPAPANFSPTAVVACATFPTAVGATFPAPAAARPSPLVATFPAAPSTEGRTAFIPL